MFVKMHRIITQKTCHLLSATVFQWLWVSQLIIRERIDSSESQNEPPRCEEISLTVFGWAVFTLQCGGVGTLRHPCVNWSNVRTLTRCRRLLMWHLEQQLDIFSNDKASYEIMNILFHSASFCHMISGGYGSNFQAAEYKVLHTVSSNCGN